MASAISGVKGIFYGSTLVDLKTGQKISFEAIISGAGGSATPVQWGDIQNKPTIIASGPTPQAARVVIGAGTSDLVIGTTATTAKAGNYVPAWTDVTGKPTTFAPAIGTTATTAMAGDKFVKGAAVADLAGDADLATTVAKINILLATLRTGKFIA